MKFYAAILTALFIQSFSFSQTEQQAIEQIKSQFRYINSQTNYVVSELNNEDYLDQMPDNGAQLKGFFRNDSIYKIIEWTGLSYAVIIKEYYFLKDELVFVYDSERDYNHTKDSSGQFSGFDYTGARLKYEARHYFNKGKEIKKTENGKQLIGIDSSIDYQEEAEALKNLLRNKKDNQDSYDKIQGMWQSTTDSLNTIEFSGLSLFDYYEGKYLGQSKIKIDKGYLFTKSIKDNNEFKYEIMSLSDLHLTLLYLPVGKLLTYKKRK
jgi:hypothetical protein